MASSDNLVTMEPSWAFHPTFADSWQTEAFARDTETLTRVLQKSLSDKSDNLSSEMINPFYPPDTTAVETLTVSCGSENETTISKRMNGVGGNGGKMTKRKSRASKRDRTTFITVDPSNFRQVVQQVTGVRFGGNAQLPIATVLKQEPQRPANKIQSGGLPTLDTSAFLLDHAAANRQGHQVGPAPGLMVQPQAVFTMAPPLVAVAVNDGGAVGVDFGSFGSFPTLESWN